MPAEKLFKTESRANGPERRIVQVARCSSCPAEHVFNVTTAAHGGMPDDSILRKLAVLGWRHARQGKRLSCPACAGTKAPAGALRCAGAGCESLLPIVGRDQRDGMPAKGLIKGAMRKAGWSNMLDNSPTCAVCTDGTRAVQYLEKVARIGLAAAEVEYDRRCADATRMVAKQGLHGTVVLNFHDTMAQIRATAEAFVGGSDQLDTLLADMAQIRAEASAVRATERNDPAMALAEAPRTPTRDEKRAIMDKLNAVYAEGAYADAWSDKAVAGALNVPVAWVAEIRAEFFGEADVSEAELAKAREHQRVVNECRADLKAVKADLTAAMDKLAAVERKADAITRRLDSLETGKA
jgi:hypothetical protein